MTTLTEGDLRLTLREPVSGRPFDDSQHGLSHCMKAVDWILEFPERVCFVEVKDPDTPLAQNHRQRDRFVQSLLAGNLTPSLVLKFRDSFLYEWACNRLAKPLSYYVIVASERLDDAQLLTRTEELKRTLPVGTPAGWSRPVANDCYVFNVEKWNEVFPEYPLSRLSVEGTQPS